MKLSDFLDGCEPSAFQVLQPGQSSLNANTRRTYSQAMAYISAWRRVRQCQALKLEDQMILFIEDHYQNNQNVARSLVDLKARKSTKPLRYSTMRTRLDVWMATEGGFEKVKKILSRLKAIYADKGLGIRHTTPVTLSELKAVERAIDTSTVIGLRRLAMIRICFYSGGRRADELARMAWQDTMVTKRGCKLLLGRSKGDRDRDGLWVPIHGKAWTALKNWSEAMEPEQRHVGPIFRRVRGSRVLDKALCVDRVRKDLAAIIKNAGLDAKPHGIRAGFINWAMGNKHTDDEIMAMTGHKTLNALETYKERIEPEKNTIAIAIK